jgi:hypothetical protein
VNVLAILIKEALAFVDLVLKFYATTAAAANYIVEDDKFVKSFPKAVAKANKLDIPIY